MTPFHGQGGSGDCIYLHYPRVGEGSEAQQNVCMSSPAKKCQVRIWTPVHRGPWSLGTWNGVCLFVFPRRRWCCLEFSPTLFLGVPEWPWHSLGRVQRRPRSWDCSCRSALLPRVWWWWTRAMALSLPPLLPTLPRPPAMSLMLKITKNDQNWSGAVQGTVHTFHFLLSLPWFSRSELNIKQNFLTKGLGDAWGRVVQWKNYSSENLFKAT